MGGGDELRNVVFGTREENYILEVTSFNREFFLSVSSSVVIHSIVG